MTLGQKIQQLRKASGISQEQLAEQLHVSRQSVSKWELDDAVPELSKIILLSDLFAITIDELLRDSPRNAGPSPEPGFVMHISTSPIENIVWTCIYWSFGLFIPLVIQYCILQSSSSAKKRLAKGGKRREKN